MCFLRTVAGAAVLIMIVGCGSESTHDKMMRIAKERSAAVARQKARDAEDEKLQEAAKQQQASKVVKQAEAEEAEEAATEEDAGEVPAETQLATNEHGQSVLPVSSQVSKPRSRRRDDDEDDVPIEEIPDAEEAVIPDELVAFVGAGRQVAYVGESKSIGVFDVASQRLSRQIYNRELNPISLAIGRQGDLMLVGGASGHLKTFSIGSVDSFDKYQQIRMMRRDAMRPRKAHDAPVTAVAMDESLELAASGDTSGRIKVWRGVGESEIEFATGDAVITKLMTVGNRRSLLGASSNRLFHWNYDENEPVPGAFDGLQVEQEITALAVAANGKSIAVGDVTGRITTWTAEVEDALVRRSFSAYGGRVSSVAFGREGESLVTVSQAGEVSQWDFPIQQQIRFSPAQPTKLMVASPDSQLIGLSSYQRNLDLYALPHGTAVRRHTINSGELAAADFSTDGSLVALGNHEGRVYFQNADKKAVAYTQCDSSAIVQIARSTGGNNDYAFISASGQLGVASFPGKAEIPVVVQGEIACVSQDGESMLIARGGQLHAVDVKDARIFSSARMDDDQVTAIWIDDAGAFLGTESGSLWLWDFSDGKAQPEAIQLSAHETAIDALTRNAKGQIASCDKQGVIVVTPFGEDTNPISETASRQSSFQFSGRPSVVVAAPGVLLAAVGGNLEEYSLNAVASEPVLQSKSPFRCLAVDKLGKRIAACDDSNQLWIHDETLEVPKTIPLPIKQAVAIAWSEDGSRVATTDGSRIVVVEVDSASIDSQCVLAVPPTNLFTWLGDNVWFLGAESELQRMRLPRIRWTASLGEEGSAIAWSDEADTVAALTRPGAVAKFEAATGRESARVATGQGESRSLISVHGTHEFAFLVGNADVMILNDGGEVERLPIASAIGLRQLNSSADGRFLYTVNAIGAIVAWDRSQQGAETVPCEVSCDYMLPLDQKHLVAASGKTSEAAIVPLSQQCQSSLRIGGSSSSIVLASDGSIVAIADDSEVITLIPTDGGERKELTAAGLTFRKIAINNDASRVASLATTDDDQDVLVIWDVAASQMLERFSLSKNPKAVHYSNDSLQVAVAFPDGHCEIFDATSATMLESTPAKRGLESFVFAADGTGLVTSDDQGRVTQYPLLALGQTQTDQNAIVALEILGGDVPRLICCSRNGQVSVWDANDLSSPASTLEGITGPLVSCQVSPDRRFLCVVYEDPENTICVWDIEEIVDSDAPIKPTAVIHNSARVHCAAFSWDSQQLLLGATNGTVSCWSIGEARLVANYARHTGKVLRIRATDESGVFLTAGEDKRVCSSHLPAIIPAAGTEIPRESLVQMIELADLEPPQALADDYRDPFDAAREALVAGASSFDVLDLIGGESDRTKEVKQILSRIVAMESGSKLSPAELSQLRRELAESQRQLAPAANARSLASFADGFSNSAFSADTNFQFDADEEFRPVKLLFSDRYLYAARTSLDHRKRRRDPDLAIADDSDNGALLSWDYRYTRLQAHAWSLEDLNIQELFPLPNSAGVFTVPQMLLFNHDGSSRELPQAASWAYSNLPKDNRQFIAVGSASTRQTETDIMKIFDVAELSKDNVAPLSQYRGFEGIVTAVAFANQSPNIAFCVRGRAVHRLFIADAETLTLTKLEEVDHESPWVRYDVEERRIVHTNAAPGITSLAFSDDDKVLVGHGQYNKSLYKFSQWNLQWNENGRISNARKSSKELEDETGPLIQESGSKSIWFVKSPQRRDSADSSGKVSLQLNQSSLYRILVRVKDGFMVVNLNANREEQKIEFLTTQRKEPLYAVTDDGRWLIMGDDNGVAYIWDILEGDRYSVTIDSETEDALKDPTRRLKDLIERPAHTGPIAGVALSKPDPGRDYPAFAATFGEENKVKVWELFPILDPQQGLRSRNVAKYPVARTEK